MNLRVVGEVFRVIFEATITFLRSSRSVYLRHGILIILTNEHYRLYHSNFCWLLAFCILKHGMLRYVYLIQINACENNGITCTPLSNLIDHIMNMQICKVKIRSRKIKGTPRGVIAAYWHCLPQLQPDFNLR